MSLLALCLLSACATSPTGRKQLILVPDTQMDAMGQEAFAQIRQQEPVLDNPKVNRYVACVAERLLEQVDSDEQWSLAVFEEPEMVNAFALPGGRIGVYTGLLDVADTQDKLAAVIAHEIGHVIAQHGAERVSQNVALAGGLEAARLALGDVSQRDTILGALGLGALVGVLLPYSRTHESEADEIGQQLMAMAGFDPRASVELWRAMAKQGGEGPLELLSTHPSHETRIEDLQASMDEVLPLYREARQQGRTPQCRPVAV